MESFKIENIDIKFFSNEEISKQHIKEDCDVLKEYGLEKIIKEQFIPWLKGEDFKEKDDGQIYDGLKLYEVTYTYGKIIEKYSPTQKEGYFGQFEFDFEVGNEYVEDIFEAVAMEVFVYEGKIVKVSGFDI